MKRIITAIAFIALTSALWASGQEETPELGPGLYAEIETNRGVMIFELDYEGAPLTVVNFCGLAEGILPNDAKSFGEPFYDGLGFYREAPGYAVFSGDPEESGIGGPGYTLPRERGAAPDTSLPGTLVMDGFVTESAGSRFFVTIEGDGFLNDRYTAFGTLVSGSKILEKLKRGDVVESVRISRIGAEAEALSFDDQAFRNLYDEARAAEIEALGDIDPALAALVEGMGDERQKTTTGIYYRVVAEGTGIKPVMNSQVSMHYTGTLLDGTVFDSSVSRGQTFDFTLGVDGVIPGWVEMVMDMKAGEKRKVVIPPELAYGKQGYGPIAPNSWLVFDMELVAVLQE
jgi:peptidyl-prolyl cis-trans isomerase A (cyclophilin A)